MTYYFDHLNEIDREIQEEWRQAQDQRTRSSPSPLYLLIERM